MAAILFCKQMTLALVPCPKIYGICLCQSVLTVVPFQWLNFSSKYLGCYGLMPYSNVVRSVPRIVVLITVHLRWFLRSASCILTFVPYFFEESTQPTKHANKILDTHCRMNFKNFLLFSKFVIIEVIIRCHD